MMSTTASMQERATSLVDEIIGLCQPTVQARDLSLWRSFLALWHDANIFDDQPLDLGGSGLLRKPGKAIGSTSSHISANDAEAKLSEFESELASRRWIKRARQSTKLDGLEIDTRSPPPQRTNTTLSEIEKDPSKLNRSLSMPSSIFGLPRRTSTSLSLQRILSPRRDTGPPPRQRFRSAASSLLPNRLSNVAVVDEEGGGRVPKVRNSRSRELIETFLELHRIQIAIIRDYEEREESQTRARLVEDGFHRAEVERIGDQLAAYTLSGEGASVGTQATASIGPTCSGPAQSEILPNPEETSSPAATDQVPLVTIPPFDLTLTALINNRLQNKIPSLEDHRCAICLSIAYRPVLLPGCQHLFCLRCLVKLQRSFFASLRSRDGAGGEDRQRMGPGPMRSVGSMAAWVLYEQEAEYRETIRAQQRLREEVAAEREERLREDDAEQLAREALASRTEEAREGTDAPTSTPSSGNNEPTATTPRSPPTAIKPRAASADCPLCRHPQAVALADGSHVSAEREAFMKLWFAREVKAKKKADLVEVEKEEALRLGLEQTSCVVM
ncbi:hypothetical protein CF319_g1778 [Tilletia indica]|nr:hypothetical protein CF319_g1778 [Tilletia indica]